MNLFIHMHKILQLTQYETDNMSIPTPTKVYYNEENSLNFSSKPRVFSPKSSTWL